MKKYLVILSENVDIYIKNVPYFMELKIHKSRKDNFKHTTNGYSIGPYYGDAVLPLTPAIKILFGLTTEENNDIIENKEMK